MFGLPAQFWSQDVYEIGASLLSIAERMWWVWMLILFAWFLRWYGKAREAGVDSPGIRGLTLWMMDFFRTGRQAVIVMVGAGVALLGFLGFALNVIPAGVSGVLAGDPLSIALVSTLVALASTPIDEHILGEHLMTPTNAIFVFLGVLVVAMAVKRGLAYYEQLD